MRTLVLDPSTAGLEPILELRKRSGLDRMDEIWEGVLHMFLRQATHMGRSKLS